MSQQTLQRHHQQQAQHQQQQQVNQSGILPLPSTGKHIQQVPLHQVVINTENTVSTYSFYFYL